MGTIGLRFPPASGTDPQQHAAQLALLASDVAHVPPEYLERAANEWAVKSPYMPKASELIGLAQGYVSRSTGPRGGYGSQEYLDRANQNCSRVDLEWIYDAGGNMQLRQREGYKSTEREYALPLTDAEIRKMPEWIIKMGITIGDLDADHCARIRSA